MAKKKEYINWFLDEIPILKDKGNLYQYLFDRNSDCFCLKISE